MKVQRIEQIIIKKSHPKFKIIDEMCINARILYNEANSVLQEHYKSTGEYIKYKDMNYMFKTYDSYKNCFSQPANCVMRLLDKNWKSYFKSIKDYEKYPYKYRGRPQLPSILDNDARIPWMFPNNQVLYLYDNNTVYIRNRLLNDYKWKSKCLGRLIQVRFVYHKTYYSMEIIYETELNNLNQNSSRIISIDLGVENLATISNNIGISPFIINGKILKSINQQYLKQYHKILDDLQRRNGRTWSRKIESLNDKRHFRVKDYIHKSTAYIIKWCIENNIDTIIVGRNKYWKQANHMTYFMKIPFNMFREQLKYKSENIGINYIEVNEAYTSGTSYLDNEDPIKENYDKSRRITRGLFKSQNMLINADVNGSLQIMKKVFPNAYTGYGIEVDPTPVIINPLNING